MDIDLVVWLSVHVDVDIVVQGHALLELGETEVAQSGDFLAGQLGGLDLEIHLHDAAHCCGQSIDGICLIDAGGVCVF